jgi:hypothetical protein
MNIMGSYSFSDQSDLLRISHTTDDGDDWISRVLGIR